MCCRTVHLFVLWKSPGVCVIEQSICMCCGKVQVYVFQKRQAICAVENSGGLCPGKVQLCGSERLSWLFLFWKRQAGCVLQNSDCLSRKSQVFSIAEKSHREWCFASTSLLDLKNEANLA